MNDAVTSAELQALQVQSAQSVNRTSTVSCWRAMPICPISPATNAITNWDNEEHGYTMDKDLPFPTTLELIGLPHGHELSQVKIYIKPSSGHQEQPEYLPSATVYRLHHTNHTLSAIGDEAYPSAGWNANAYEAGFDLVVDCNDSVIDRTAYTYLLDIIHESGSPSQDSVMCGIQAYVTIDSSDGGPDFPQW